MSRPIQIILADLDEIRSNPQGQTERERDRDFVRRITRENELLYELERVVRQLGVLKPNKCSHLWHDNPALITPCPECGSEDN